MPREGRPYVSRAMIRTLLSNPLRSDIMAVVKERPGINPFQVAQRLGVHPNAVDFHVERLRNAGIIEIRSAADPRERLCFAHDDVRLWEDRSTRVLFGRGAPRDVAAYVVAHPGASSDQVADALGMSVHTVRKHLRTLVAHDLVGRLRVENNVFYHAPENRLDWLLDPEHSAPRSRRDR